MQQGVEVAFRTARTIAGALVGGVVMFWVIGLVLTKGGTEGVAAGGIPVSTAIGVWAPVAIVGFVLALRFRGRALQVSESATRNGEAITSEQAGTVQSNLLIGWAALEAPALFSGALFLNTAAKEILWLAIPVYLVGMFLTFPRAEWFGAR